MCQLHYKWEGGRWYNGRAHLFKYKNKPIEGSSEKVNEHLRTKLM
jgi:hypothetical protein